LIKAHPLFLSVVVVALVFGFVGELLLMFAIVLFHEYGHWYVANRLGWHVKAIRLLPFGGEVIADISHVTNAREELLVALAGPAVNVLFIMFILVLKFTFGFDGYWYDYFLQANVTILLFNLLPVMPLDGGKIVHALLFHWIPYAKLQHVITHLSLIISLSICLFALTGINQSGLRFNLLLIGIFLLYSNLNMLRQLPFIFWRFLLHKWNEWQIDCGEQRSFLVIRVVDEFRAMSLLKKVYRNRWHQFIILNRDQQKRYVIHESDVLETLFETKK
jgi:stage IV sporulation protein FB